jgi:hypothetical protein
LPAGRRHVGLQPRREGVTGLVERLPQMLRERVGFVVGQVKVLHDRDMGSRLAGARLGRDYQLSSSVEMIASPLVIRGKPE